MSTCEQAAARGITMAFSPPSLYQSKAQQNTTPATAASTRRKNSSWFPLSSPYTALSSCMQNKGAPKATINSVCPRGGLYSGGQEERNVNQRAERTRKKQVKDAVPSTEKVGVMTGRGRGLLRSHLRSVVAVRCTFGCWGRSDGVILLSLHQLQSSGQFVSPNSQSLLIDRCSPWFWWERSIRTYHW